MPPHEMLHGHPDPPLVPTSAPRRVAARYRLVERGVPDCTAVRVDRAACATL